MLMPRYYEDDTAPTHEDRTRFDVSAAETAMQFLDERYRGQFRVAVCVSESGVHGYGVLHAVPGHEIREVDLVCTFEELAR